jgi:hypothetical protein
VRWSIAMLAWRNLSYGTGAFRTDILDNIGKRIGPEKNRDRRISCLAQLRWSERGAPVQGLLD